MQSLDKLLHNFSFVFTESILLSSLVHAYTVCMPFYLIEPFTIWYTLQHVQWWDTFQVDYLGRWYTFPWFFGKMTSQIIRETYIIFPDNQGNISWLIIHQLIDWYILIHQSKGRLISLIGPYQKKYIHLQASIFKTCGIYPPFCNTVKPVGGTKQNCSHCSNLEFTEESGAIIQ